MINKLSNRVHSAYLLKSIETSSHFTARLTYSVQYQRTRLTTTRSLAITRFCSHRLRFLSACDTGLLLRCFRFSLSGYLYCNDHLVSMEARPDTSVMLYSVFHVRFSVFRVYQTIQYSTF